MASLPIQRLADPQMEKRPHYTLLGYDPNWPYYSCWWSRVVSTQFHPPGHCWHMAPLPIQRLADPQMGKGLTTPGDIALLFPCSSECDLLTHLFPGSEWPQLTLSTMRSLTMLTDHYQKFTCVNNNSNKLTGQNGINDYVDHTLQVMFVFLVNRWHWVTYYVPTNWPNLPWHN